MEYEATDYLERHRSRLRSGAIRARSLVLPGRPADAILAAAESEDASMIAMSTHGRSGVARLMLGSVTEEVMRRSPLPLFVAHASPQGVRFEKNGVQTILVPFDGTEESLCVEPLVIATARLFGAGVAILRVEEVPGWGYDLGFVGHLMDGPVRVEDQPELLDRDLIEAGNRFAREGLRTTLFRVRGELAMKINQLAGILPAGMIIMASHGRRGVSRLISGSVAEEVVRKAALPVLVKRIGSAPAMAAVPERRVS
jgi:nucleotide-binding universal stress UspA family protein